jgi:putative ABC transport system permease protein
MRSLWRRILELVAKPRLEREAAEELAHHIELAVEAKRRAGVDEAEARRQARLELGSPDLAREQLAEGRTGFVLEQIARELAYAARVLRRTPGVALLSIATMSIGIGASAVLFALVNSIVLSPLPYPESERLVRIIDTNPQLGIEETGAASGNIDDWRHRTATFEGIAGFYSMGRTLSSESDAEVLITAQVSEDFFPILRVAPLLGRTFSEEETRRSQFNIAASPVGPDPVAILSYQLWQQRFGGDRDIVGRTVMLERRAFKIVGVMPDRFSLPDSRVQLWIPWDLSRERPRDQHYLAALGRLKSGVSMSDAEAELNRVARDLGVEYPQTNAGWGVRLRSLREEAIGDTARVLWVLLAAVGLVLLVACANVALLSLMRGLDRAEETAVRIALGASSTRLLRQFLLESVLLASIGGALGTVLATLGLRVLPRLASDLPRLDEVVLDRRALVFILAVTALAAIISGLPPAWRRARRPPVQGLGNGSPRATTSADGHFVRDAMVVAQVALSVVLLAGSGLLVRSFVQLRTIDPGFDPNGVLVLPIFLDMQAYGSGDRVRRYYQTLFERLGAIPGVVAVGGATSVPTSPLGADFERPVWPESVQEEAARVPASVRIATPGYFSALKLAITDGRGFDERDRPKAQDVVMISETLARRLWPGQRAVGQRLVVDYSTAGTYPHEIIGVVKDVRFRGPRSAPLAEIYLAHAQRSYLILNVTLRSAVDPRTLIPTVRQVLKDIDPQKPAHGIYVLDDLLGATVARDRQAMLTLLVFAAAAIVLAVISVYGVLSQRVRERSREIGIRIAIGADRSRVLGWVARIGLRIFTVGGVIGLLAAWALSGTLAGLLYGVTPTDPLTVILVVVLLAAVGSVATLIPSWRATRVDPVTVLRRG